MSFYSYFYLTIAFFSVIFVNGNSEVRSQSLVDDEVLIYQGKLMKIVVPMQPLALGSVQIIPRGELENFYEWDGLKKSETYELIQKIVAIWQKKKIISYMIYARESHDSSFKWEIVPYSSEGEKFWKQLKVLWNITFGGLKLSKDDRQNIAEDFQKESEIFSKPVEKAAEPAEEATFQKDAFCNSEIIERQKILEGKEVNVLYNYAPMVLNKDKLDFLITPKKHRFRFSDLTKEEYLEVMQFSQKLCRFYKDKGYETAFIFDKTGSQAGQTIPHFHEHLVFTASKTQEIFGKLQVLKNMLFGSSPLSEVELQERVGVLKNELREILSK
jgi:diadenosine tetraphosphate (Ap4A) HIT family hydrolase